VAGNESPEAPQPQAAGGNVRVPEALAWRKPEYESAVVWVPGGVEVRVTARTEARFKDNERVKAAITVEAIDKISDEDLKKIGRFLAFETQIRKEVLEERAGNEIARLLWYVAAAARDLAIMLEEFDYIDGEVIKRYDLYDTIEVGTTRIKRRVDFTVVVGGEEK